MENTDQITPLQQTQNLLQRLIDKKFSGASFSSDQLEKYVDSLIDPETISPERWDKIAEFMPWQSKVKMMGLTYQPYFDMPLTETPNMKTDLSCRDDVTIKTWFAQWKRQFEHNALKYDIMNNLASNEIGKQALKPVIIAGSGPSLAKNIDALRDHRGDICLVSCLHNFAYFEDNGVSADYYVNLDAGECTVDEMCIGGKQDKEYYFELSKDRVLVTPLVGHPGLHENWKGKVLWYNTAADESFHTETKKILNVPLFFRMGGNVLGSCFYFAKCILGGNPIIFIGADFSFGYNKRFHSYVTDYDRSQGDMAAVDVFGNKVYTWPSYYGFKRFFEYEIMGGRTGIGGIYINCTEGGLLGAYPQGNMRQIIQRDLASVLYEYNLYKLLPGSLNPDKPQTVL